MKTGPGAPTKTESEVTSSNLESPLSVRLKSTSKKVPLFTQQGPPVGRGSQLGDNEDRRPWWTRLPEDIGGYSWARGGRRKHLSALLEEPELCFGSKTFYTEPAVYLKSG